MTEEISKPKVMSALPNTRRRDIKDKGLVCQCRSLRTFEVRHAEQTESLRLFHCRDSNAQAVNRGGLLVELTESIPNMAAFVPTSQEKVDTANRNTNDF